MEKLEPVGHRLLMYQKLSQFVSCKQAAVAVTFQFVIWNRTMIQLNTFNHFPSPRLIDFTNFAAFVLNAKILSLQLFGVCSALLVISHSCNKSCGRNMTTPLHI
jgi:uncharacterized membrane protein